MDWLDTTAGLVGAICAVLGALVAWLAQREQTAVNNRLLTGQMEQTKKNWEQEKIKLGEERETLRRQLEQSQRQASTLSTQVNELNQIKERYLAVRARLEKSFEVRTYRQPVLLVGPRLVGKTSLLTQWHAPWDHSHLDRTQTIKTCEVPVFSFTEVDKDRHFADPDIFVSIETQLILRVHDFPGEPSSQKAILETVKSEMQALRSESRKNLGLVIVCMFDAEEATTGISKETREYYNGELFRDLRSLVTFREVELERLIFVFNKCDRLRQKSTKVGDRELLELCIEKFDYIFATMRTFCNRDKVCEVFTILSREELLFKNQGATIVKGEAARGLVQAFAKDHVRARPLLEQRATNIVRTKFI
jgi:hypothetical protein